METNSTASPNSSPMYNCATQPATESTDYSSFFPPKFTLPSSLSLTPSTLSDDERDEDCNTMQLVVECQELRDQLQDLNNVIDSLRRENANLRSSNTDLVKLLSSPTALQSFLNASAYLNPFLADDFRPLGTGVLGPRDGVGSDEASNISPTSVIIERNRFNADRFSLPKSISVRSSSYKRVNQSFGTNQQQQEGPIKLVSGPQNVYLGGGKRDQVEEGCSTGAAAATAAMKVKAYNQGMLKTELCNKWQESGTCPYGDNCQFAHGVRELRPVKRHPRYKTQICRMVLTRGTCPYGHRCHFRHSLDHQDR